MRISGDRLRQEYNPDAIQWSISGEWPGKKEQITEEKGHGKMAA